MKRKAKGLNAERELVRMFAEQGWHAVRVAGSGSTKYPAPDVIAAKGSRRLVIECKTTISSSQYLKQKQMDELEEFGKSLLAETWVAVKFSSQPWLFIPIHELKKTPLGYSIDRQTIQRRGIVFEELIS